MAKLHLEMHFIRAGLREGEEMGVGARKIRSPRVGNTPGASLHFASEEAGCAKKI